ncbi:MAG TPA: hypothetical protein VGJ66_10865 [Pyrinomonadaceae bacterium]
MVSSSIGQAFLPVGFQLWTDKNVCPTNTNAGVGSGRRRVETLIATDDYSPASDSESLLVAF